MKLDAEWLRRAETVAVMRALGEAFFVGGCVRNTLLGVPVSDVDIATPLLPEEVIARVEAAGLKAVPTGLSHGTVTVVSGGVAHEVTTFRRDIETDGRHAVVAFTQDVAEDAARRDFTMNALYAAEDGAVIDPLSGLADLQARRVRFIGDAAARIGEDALRMLRFYRFFAQYGVGEADAEARAAISARVGDLAGLSAERVTQEMRKLLGAGDPLAAVVAMAEDGVLAKVLPGFDVALLPWVVRAGGAQDWFVRALALGGERSRLRLSGVEERAFAQAETAWALGAGVEERAYRFGAKAALRVATLEAGILRRGVGADVAALAEVGASRVLPVRAADLCPPLEPGPALGAALKAAEEAWVASGFALEREALVAVALAEG
ncbi:MAG: CCA tRNA nucleotidyltransferase [Pseudomonadota bacterium]